MIEIFTVGGGDYVVNVFQAVAAWAGNGGYKSLLQVVMVMGLALSALTLAFNQDWRAWLNWFLGATLMYTCLMVPRTDVHITDRLNPSLAPANTGLLIESTVALAEAERIEIGLPQIGSATAHVVWTSENFYGCRFDAPVPASALSALELSAQSAPVPAPGEPGDTLPVRIARLRKQQGLTLEALAALVNVSKPTVWAWEQGKARPTPERITALAERLGVGEEELRTGRDGDALAEALSQARRMVAKAYGVDPARVKVSIELE